MPQTPSDNHMKFENLRLENEDLKLDIDDLNNLIYEKDEDYEELK